MGSATPRRLSRRQLRTDVVSALLLGAAAVAMALLCDGRRPPSVLDVSLLVMLAASLSRVKLLVRGGLGMPTQLVLVPILSLLRPAAVPVTMAAGLFLGTLGDVLAGRCRADGL